MFRGMLNYLNEMTNLTSYSLSVCFVGALNASSVIYTQDQTQIQILDLLFGPLGALALSLLGVYFLAKYLLKLNSEKDKQYEERLKDKDEQIKLLQDELNKIREKYPN